MKWLLDNKLRIAKWGGLGVGCVLVALSAFVGARYIASGEEYEGNLDQLVAPDVSYVLHIPSVPKARVAGESWLDELLLDQNLPVLESSPLWRDKLGKAVDGDLRDFRENTLRKGLDSASRQADEAGVRLFEDALAGELILAADAGKDGGFVALSRVTRPVRFRWQFMDLAQGFFPDDPRSPKVEYEDGTLKLTPKQKPGADDAKPVKPLLITLLGDVLVIADSPRLFNAALKAHGGEKGLAENPQWKAARKLPSAEDAARHNLTLWVNLDQMRKRLPPEETGDSPVDTYTSLPASVVGVYPDILEPVNLLLVRNLDTTVFSTALYGFDLSEPNTVRFDQYLMVDEARANDPAYAHLVKTWAQPARKASQLDLLPDDTMFQVSYRQPLEVVYSEVFDEKARNSLVGDFIVAMRGQAVKDQLAGEVEELLFAAAPRATYAPNAAMPVSGTDLPLPAFAIGFRSPGAKEEAAKALLGEYLQAQRGRSTKPGEPPKTGAVTVIELAVEGRRVWGFHDPREEDSFIKRLNLSIRAAVVGDWILLTNSEPLLARALAGGARALGKAADSPFAQLPATSSATIYLNWDAFADFATNPALFKVLRDAKYNTGLIDGLDPGEVRREIAASFGLDPQDVKSLADQRVAAEFARRKEVWLQKCQVEGDRHVADLQANFRALRFFRDLAMTTAFAPDHLHVKGVMRIG